MKLSAETEKLICHEVNKLVTSEKELLRDLSFHKKSVRTVVGAYWALLIITVGGSIWGLQNVNKLIEDKVAKTVSTHIEYLDRVSTAVYQSYAENWDSAILNLYSVFEHLDKKKIAITDGYKENLYRNTIWVLANAEKDDSGGWNGKDLWERIRKNEDFKLFRRGWENERDSGYQLNMAIIELKFHSGSEIPQTVEKRLKASYKFANKEFEIADRAYRLGLFYIIKEELKDATKYIKIASRLDPEQYRIEDWTNYKASFIGYYYFRICKEVYKDLYNKDFVNVVSGLLKNIEDKKD